MKNYMLKKWYPSLKKTVKTGSVVSKIYNCGGYNYRGSDSEGNVYYVGGGEVENNPDFWELIEEEEKPLFITEDGVEVFDKDFNFIMVDYVFEKFYASYVELVKPLNTDIFKYFAHESNADEYIAWYKKEFSINDLLLADVGITTSQLDKLQELAKKG